MEPPNIEAPDLTLASFVKVLQLNAADSRPDIGSFTITDAIVRPMSEADVWALVASLVGSGGHLVVETPCEHGFVGPHWQDDPKPDDPKDQFHCPGGSRRVVWPTDKEEG